MTSYMAMAAHDLTARGELPPADLWQRFLGWVHPRRTGREGEVGLPAEAAPIGNETTTQAPSETTTPPPSETTTPPPGETTTPPPGKTTAPRPSETTTPPPSETTVSGLDETTASNGEEAIDQ
ncbi:hypothetical protein AB0M36_00135 [Actinoplanes sp. NPDC051346]|uniref:hypothetical protein n=1 Tax=Actinoplanes sp. NPDC051346 TaxID=3155048 RepID=UPI00344624DC